MSDSYIEILVKKQPKTWYSFVKGLFLFATIFVFVVLGLMQVNIIFIVLGALLGVASYFVYQDLDLEFEFLFVNGDLSVYKIMGKSTIKNCVELSLEQIEIVAPVKSWHLGDYSNQKTVTADYSSGNENANVYAAYYKGNKGMTKMLFEPDDKMLNAMHQMAPRKVFFE